MVIAGGAGDRCSASGRSIVLIVGLLTATAGLLALMAVPAEAQSLTPVLLIGIVAFGLLGPYS